MDKWIIIGIIILINFVLTYFLYGLESSIISTIMLSIILIGFEYRKIIDWMTGRAVCIKCNRDWYSVGVGTTKDFMCPDCIKKRFVIEGEKMKTFKGDLILKKNTVFKESITVEGNIVCKDGCWDINCRDINCYGNINCWDINCCGNINCGDINCRDINCCGNINCWDINCGDINCYGNINCGDINCCGNINCGGDINCWDISYYAVCFAYNNIKCKSIKGRREHARHFVLDGKITVKR